MTNRNYVISKERFIEVKESFKKVLLHKDNKKANEFDPHGLDAHRIRLAHFVIYNILRGVPASRGIKDINTDWVQNVFRVLFGRISFKHDSFRAKYYQHYFGPFSLTEEEMELVKDEVLKLKSPMGDF